MKFSESAGPNGRTLALHLQQKVFRTGTFFGKPFHVAEEVLGYNVSYVTGGGTLAGMQAIAGCTNPGAADPECGAEVPCNKRLWHVVLARQTDPVFSHRMLPGQ